MRMAQAVWVLAPCAPLHKTANAVPAFYAHYTGLLLLRRLFALLHRDASGLLAPCVPAQDYHHPGVS